MSATKAADEYCFLLVSFMSGRLLTKFMDEGLVPVL